MERTTYEALQQVMKHEECQHVIQLRRDAEVLRQRNRSLLEEVTRLNVHISSLARSIVRTNSHMEAGRVARAVQWLQQICIHGGSKGGLDKVWTKMKEIDDEELV